MDVRQPPTPATAFSDAVRRLRRWREARARSSETAARVLYAQLVRSGSLCFDVGANVGNRTSMFVGLGASVVAVEPQPACVAELERRFGDAISIVAAALGDREGRAELLVADYPTLSTLNSSWADAVQRSGRFTEFSWDRRIEVEVTTLDSLISRFGSPDFCKIDVEGYELEALRGLSQPVGALSFEFDHELLDARLACVEYLDRLGMDRFNFSQGESFRFTFRSWVDAETLRAFLTSTPRDAVFFGDVYAAAHVTRPLHGGGIR